VYELPLMQQLLCVFDSRDILKAESKEAIAVGNCSSFFANRECEYYPCHAIDDSEELNCLFCYCPLYTRDDCGGDFCITANGIKDCSACLVPHRRENYDEIIRRLR